MQSMLGLKLVSSCFVLVARAQDLHVPSPIKAARDPVMSRTVSWQTGAMSIVHHPLLKAHALCEHITHGGSIFGHRYCFTRMLGTD